MKENKKLAAVVTLCVLGMCFFQWKGTASAAELVVNGGPDNMTNEQKAEWVDKIDGGGYGIAHDDSLSNNRIELVGGDFSLYKIKGGEAKHGDALNNSVTLKDITNDEGLMAVYGGCTDNGDAKNNIVNIFGDAKINRGYITGGYTDNGNAKNNIVNISGDVKIQDVNIYGGYTENGDAKNNIVNISSDVKIEGVTIYGGCAENGKIENNSVIIQDSVYKGIIVGGHGEVNNESDIVDNYVEIYNSNVSGLVYGGRGYAAKNVSDNVVNIIGSTNQFAVENVSGTVSIYGGSGNSVSTTQYNVVNIIDSKFFKYDDNVNKICGGKGNVVKENRVLISNSTFEGQLIGGGAKKQAVGNTVIINQSTINQSTINQSTIKKGSGGKQSDIAGGLVDVVGKADDNYVAIIDSIVARDIYGGLSIVIPDSNIDNTALAANTEGSANNNTVYIKNSKVGGTIVAGRVVAADDVTSEANNNTIIISGEKTDITSAALVGALDAKKGTGNTLVLDGWSGSANSVKGFNNYSFQNIKNIDNAVLKVGSAENIDNNTEFDVSFAGSVDLQKGDTVKLIEIENNVVSLNEKKQEASVGTSLDITGSLSGSESGKGVDFKVGKITLNRQTDLIGSANAAAAAFLVDGGELAVDGLAQINSDEYGFNTFAATHGANSDYDNSIDLKGWNNIVGVGHNAKTEAGDFAWGVFYEGGTGEYDTMNSYNGRGFNVDGKAVYNGYGAAARLNKDNGVYYEAGLRAGKLKNDLSNALLDVNGMSYGYKTESDYFGYHVGVGRAVALADGDQLDVYARYHHTKVDGDSFTVAAGDVYNLDKVYSDKIRLGGRYQDNLNEAVKVYYGAAWEYEFSGESEGSVKGYAMEKSDLGGSTFVGELGLLMNNPGSAWKVDMALQAYGGQREGIGGKVQATYHF